MDSIQPFIDYGWYTVPLKGSIKRDAKGKKTIPGFEKNWKEKYQVELNESPTTLGGVITGALSGIMAIDCDNTETTALFDAFNGKNKFFFKSKGKKNLDGESVEGNTFIFKYDPELADSFQIKNDQIELDFYADNGFVFLPTKANESKVSWTVKDYKEMPELIEMPVTMKVMLLQLKKTLEVRPLQEDKSQVSAVANYLQPQVLMFVAKGSFIPGLFRIITPKAFRTLSQYREDGYLHPEDIPEGRGSEYLSKVASILAADPSINEDLFTKALKLINNFWDIPMPESRLQQTIIRPMVEGRATIGDDVIWKFDPNWESKGLIVSTKRGTSLEVFFDDTRNSYWTVDLLDATVKTFLRDSEMFSFIDAVSSVPIARKEIKPKMPLIRVNSDPSRQFGFFNPDEYSRSFNNFKQSRALSIFNDPESYESHYTYPKTIIQYMRSLVPDNVTRNYLLKFIKRRLKTFEFTPVVPYFLGVPGSGKDTFIELLENIVGPEYVSKPSAKEFLELYNGFIVDKYFMQLDEYGNQLSRTTDKEEALGRIKMYTGKRQISIRAMRTDGFQYKHNCMIIMTANNNPLMLEAQDRRMFLIETPNVLKNEEWVVEAGGIRNVIEQLARETLDFCYYLETEIDMLSPDEYVSPPDSDGKRRLIATKLPAAQRLSYYCSNQMFDELAELAEEFEIKSLFSQASSGRIYEKDLFDLYSQMTDGLGVKRALAKLMKDHGFDKVPTTKDGEKEYFFKIPALQYYHVSPFESDDDFEDEPKINM